MPACARFFLFRPCSLTNHLIQGSLPEDATESKKPRRSDRLSSQTAGAAAAEPGDKTPITNKQHLPSPLTHVTNDESSELYKEATPTPSGLRKEELTPRKTDEDWAQSQALSSPPQDTQPLSQFVDRHPALSDDVEDEVKEGVWGYLVPLDPKYGDKPLVLKRRNACPLPDTVQAAVNGETTPLNSNKPAAIRAEEAYERTKVKGVASGGYLIGRHPECGAYLLSRPVLVPSPFVIKL